MRLTGPLTVAAGLALAAASAVQAVHLSRLVAGVGRQCARAEMRGLTEALRWRLEHDLILLDHNAVSAGRALAEMTGDSGPVLWAVLHDGDGPVLAAAGPARPLPADRVRAAVGTPRELLPAVEPGEDGTVTATGLLQIGERRLVLAAGFRDPGDPSAAASLAILAGWLCTGLAGALLLIVHGAALTAAARRLPEQPRPARAGVDAGDQPR